MWYPLLLKHKALLINLTIKTSRMLMLRENVCCKTDRRELKLRDISITSVATVMFPFTKTGRLCVSVALLSVGTPLTHQPAPNAVPQLYIITSITKIIN